MTDGTMLTVVRNGTADLMKGFAVLFMIHVHVMEQFATEAIRISSIGQISMFLGGPFCAPAFMAVMGFFVYTPSKPFIYYLKRGLALFSGGILLNITRSANLLYHIFQKEIDLNGWTFVFGADILTFAGLSLVVIACLRPLFRSSFFLWFSSAWVVAFAAPYLPPFGSSFGAFTYLQAFLWGDTAWSYFPIFPWLSYVLLGYSFRLGMAKKWWNRIPIDRSVFIGMIPIAILLVLSIPWAIQISANLHGSNGYYHHGLLFFLWVTGFLLLYLKVLQYLDQEVGDRKGMLLVKWMGRNVTIVYVIQWLIIGNMATLYFGSQNLWQTGLWFFGVLLLTLFFTWIYRKLLFQ